MQNILFNFDSISLISSNSDSSGHDIEFYEYFFVKYVVENTIFLPMKILSMYTHILDKSVALSGSTMSLRLYRSCGANTEWRQHLSSIRSCVPGNILITILPFSWAITRNILKYLDNHITIFRGNNLKYLEIS